MQKTISAIAVVSGLLAGPNAQSSNQLIIDFEEMNSDFVRLQVIEETYVPTGLLPEVFPKLKTTPLAFPSQERNKNYRIEAIYEIDDGTTDGSNNINIIMDRTTEDCFVNGVASDEFYTQRGHYEATAVGVNMGIDNAGECTIRIIEKIQGANDFNITVSSQNMPAGGISLKSSPVCSGINEDCNTVVPDTVLPGEDKGSQFTATDVGTGAFSLQGTYKIEDGGTASTNQLDVRADLNTCTVNDKSDQATVYAGNGKYYSATVVSSLGTPNDVSCSVTVASLGSIANSFTITSADGMPTMTLNSGHKHDNVEAGKTLPTSVAQGEHKVEFTSTQENGVFLMEGTYAIDDGGTEKAKPAVKMELNSSGAVTCTVNGSTTTSEFNTGGDPGQIKYYLATVNNGTSAIPEAATCSISIQQVDAPPITKARVIISNQQ